MVIGRGPAELPCCKLASTVLHWSLSPSLTVARSASGPLAVCPGGRGLLSRAAWRARNFARNGM
eukprot:292581-Hanusia_phi.AAC.1